MATLGQYYIQVNPSAEGISGKLKGIMDPAASVAGESAGKSLGSQIASAATKAIAAIGVGKLLKKSILAGADLQQSVGGIETLFGAGGAKSVQEYADAANKSIGEVKDEYARLVESENLAMDNAAKAWQTSGLSANDYMQTVTGFAAALKQSTDSELEAVKAADMAVVDMSDNANKMGSDMSSIQMAYQGFAKQNYTMLDNLKLGYGGTKGEMERLLADATALSGIEYNIENLSDVYEAIHVIQEDLGITGTTADEAASTFSGSMNAMKAAAQNLMANLSLGNDITADLSNLTGAFFTWASNLLPMVGNILKGLPAVISTALSGITQALNKTLAGLGEGNFIESGARMIADLVSGIVTALPYMAEAAVKVVAAIGTQFMATDWGAIASDLIASLKQGLDLASGEIFGSDQNILQAIMDGITANLPMLLSQGVEINTGIANGILSALPQMITTAGELLTSFAGFIAENLPIVAEKGAELISGLVSGITQNLPQIVTSAFNVVMNLASTIVSNLPTIISAGMSLIGGVLSGLLGALPQLLAAIPGMVTSMASSFMSYVGTLISTFIEMGNQAMNALSNIDWHGVGMKVVEFIANGLAAAVHFGEKLLEMGQQAWDYVCNIDWLDLGSQIVNGIASGISNFASKGVEAIRSFGQGIKDGFASFFGINSPSTVMQEQGGYMVDGLVNGLAGLPDSVNGIFGELQAGLTAKISEIAAVVSAGFVSIGAAISNAWANMGTITATAWSGLSTTIGSSLSALAANVGAQVEGVKQRVGAAWQAIQNQTAAIWNSINTITAATWKTISNTITQILTAIQSKNTQIMTAIKVFIQNTWNAIKTNTASTWTTIQSTLNTIWSGLKTKANTDFTAIKKSVLDAWKEISSDTKTKWNEIKKTVTDAIDAIRKKAEDEFPKVKDAALKAFDDIAEGLPAKIATIESVVDSLINAIKDKFSNDDGQWTGVGGAVADGIAGGITENTGVIEAAARAAAAAAQRAAERQLGIASPSKVMRDKVGAMISKGIALGITDEIGAIDRAMQAVTGIGPEFDTSYMHMGRTMQASTPRTGGYTQNLTINSPRELSPSETARLNRIATQNTILKMRMA